MNSLLHWLTNRNNFIHPSLQFPIEYIPKKTNDTIEFIRAAMGLKETTTDYYVVSVLSAIDAFPPLRKMFPSDELYRLQNYAAKPIQFQGAELVPSNITGPAHVRRLAQEWPVNMEYKTEYLDARTIQVRYGKYTESLPCVLKDDYLVVEWSEACGLKGFYKLQPGIDWTPGFKGLITFTPSNYPAQNLVAFLSSRQEKDVLLRNNGLSEHYYSAQFDVERVAVLGAALALATNKS